MKPGLFLNIILSSLFFGVIHYSNAQVPDWLWAKSIGGKNNETARSIVVDPEYGDVYTTGVFSGTVDFDPGEEIFNLSSVGSSAIFISKIDQSGQFVWARAISSQDVAYTMSIVLDPGSRDIYITGSFHGTVDFDPGRDKFNLTSAGTSDIFIAHLDGFGNFIWAKAIGGPDAVYVLSIAIDPAGSGEVYTTGFFRGTVDFDPGKESFNLISAGADDIFISKLDGNGNFIWAISFGGTGSDVSRCITLDPSENGDIYTTGCFSGSVDFDPGPNSCTITSVGRFDIFISKVDRSGKLVWAKQLGGAGVKDGSGSSIAVDPNSGDIYTTGYFEGTADFDPGKGIFDLSSHGLRDIFISKFDSMGNLLWAKTMGGLGLDMGSSMAVDLAGSGDVYTTGYFVGKVDFDPGPESFYLTSVGVYDIYISKFDDSGNFKWAKAISGAKELAANAIALDALGHAYVTGFFKGPAISFDSVILINANPSIGTADLFIAKLDALSSSLGIVDSKPQPIDIYPNPVKNKLIIKVNEEELYKLSISLFNLNGKVVYSGVFTGSNEYTIDMSGLPAALYTAEVRVNEIKIVKHIVKVQE